MTPGWRHVDDCRNPTLTSSGRQHDNQVMFSRGRELIGRSANRRGTGMRRQGYDEAHTVGPVCIPGKHGSAVHLCDGCHDGQTQAMARASERTRIVGAEEAVEHARPDVVGAWETRVFDCQTDPVVLPWVSTTVKTDK